MAIETTYTQARANLQSLLDAVTENREHVIIHRRGGDDVVMLPADELRGLIETVHLLRSPRNAQRLRQALRWALSQPIPPRHGGR
jgi:antitoxin YefM